MMGEKPGEYSPAPLCSAGGFAACRVPRGVRRGAGRRGLPRAPADPARARKLAERACAAGFRPSCPAEAQLPR